MALLWAVSVSVPLVGYTAARPTQKLRFGSAFSDKKLPGAIFNVA